MNKENKNYLYSILGTPKQLLGKHLGKEQPQEKECGMHCYTHNVFVPCDDIGNPDHDNCHMRNIPHKSPLKVGKGWKKIFKVR